MASSLVIAGLALLHLAQAAQPSAPTPEPAPLRKLPWGQINFLHTTDTHGWHGGHLQEAQYSADWGDYISFAQHLRDRADADGSDLLLIDTGDRIEGNGLFDASDPKGQYTYDIFKQQHIDIITPGNHELYLVNSSNNEYYETVPNYKNNYLASNLDIYDPETGKREALAQRFRKFTTKNQGIRIVAFGFLFDFHGNANNTVVIPVEQTVKEQWFVDAIKDREVDLFVVAGHVAIRDSSEYAAVYKAIRSQHWDTPIQFFGGHSHIRDYVVYDDKSVALESGRYMETIGFQSVSGVSTSKAKSSSGKVTFERLYIDNNLFSLHNHTGLNSTTFPTELGVNTTHAITAARKKLKLDSAYGCAPQTYWLNRAPYPANNSLISLLDQEILPAIGKNLSTDKHGDVRPAIFLTNTGAIRFDVFEGPFTVDTTFLISPFTSALRRLKDVPYEKAQKIARLLNHEGQIAIDDLLSQDGLEPLSIRERARMLRCLAPTMPPVPRDQIATHADEDFVRSSRSQEPLLVPGDPTSSLTPGYTTHDDTSSTSPGDDTIHAPIRFYRTPNVVSAEVNVDNTATITSSSAMVDLIYNEFIERWILLALRYLGERREGPGEVLAEGRSFTTLLAVWIAEHWPCPEES